MNNVFIIFNFQRKEELNEKMCIIEEIKALNNLRDLRTTEFDPSETMNFGLMCEMSLAEVNTHFKH